MTAPGPSRACADAPFHQPPAPALESIPSETDRPAPNGAGGLSEGANATFKETILETIETHALIDGMNPDRIHLTLERGPFRTGDLRHSFVDTAEGLEYRSRLAVDITLPVIERFLNFVVNRFVFTPAMLERWLRQ